MNKTISRYLERNILYPKLIDEKPQNGTAIIIVIPCHNEEGLASSILSIAQCQRPDCAVEIIVSINAGVQDSTEIKNRNLHSLNEIQKLSQQMPEWLKLYGVIHNDLPPKKAGVGLGRKIGMDEAVRRFVSIEKLNGIIVCYDADSMCTENYLQEIQNHFRHGNVQSTSIYFEHPIGGMAFSSTVYSAIIQYELHLRYFIDMQKSIGLPFSYHTVGSSMACTVSAYCAVGGMNQRKAGEDFYFIHKLVKYGHHSELNTTKVIPSPRISDRVPFGTGKAVGELSDLDDIIYLTYDPRSFLDLKQLVEILPELYSGERKIDVLPESLLGYLKSINVHEELLRIHNNTSDFESYEKMFWHWFDAFQLMKYVHFARDHYYPDLPVLEAVNSYAEFKFDTAEEALLFYRAKEYRGNSKKE